MTLIDEAQEMDDFIGENIHLTPCDGSPCSCHLPAFRAALGDFITQETSREIRRGKRLKKKG